MFVFRKIERALFYCYLRFEIHPFTLLPMFGTCKHAKGAMGQLHHEAD